MNDNQPQTQLKRYQMPALVVGVVGLVLLAGGWVLSPAQFFQAYLVGYIYWLQIALGGMAILMIYYMANGGWGYVTQRILRAAMWTLPLLALLFLPILAGIPYLYEWSDPEVVAHSELLLHKQPYLNVPFFIGRSILYFVLWIVLAFLLDKGSLALDRSPDNITLNRRMRTLSGLGLGVFGLTVTFASIDWMMSLEPEWFSTIYGIMFGTGTIASAFSFAIVTLAWIMRRTPVKEKISILNVNDLGNFLLASVMLWAYIALSQFLIIWSGNVAEVTPWYYRRGNGGWEFVWFVLVGLLFVLPFLVLLSRSIKRSINMLVKVAGLVVVMRFVDLYMLIIPAFHEQVYLDWLIIVTPIALGGLWLAVFIWLLQRHSLLPVYGARVAEEKHGHGTRHASTHP